MGLGVGSLIELGLLKWVVRLLIEVGYGDYSKWVAVGCLNF